MTRIEKAAILKLIESIEHPSVESSRFEKGKFTVVTNHREVKRLLESPDYRLGWNNCRKSAAGALEFIMSASRGDLARYSGRKGA